MDRLGFLFIINSMSCWPSFHKVSSMVFNSAHLRSDPHITKKSHVRYGRFLNTFLVSFIAWLNLIMRFSGPHSLVYTKTIGSESWKMFTLSFCFGMLNIRQSHKSPSCLLVFRPYIYWLFFSGAKFVTVSKGVSKTFLKKSYKINENVANNGVPPH